MANKAKHFWIEPDELARKGLDFCSLAAQGLWLKVMRLMHDSERYGYLSRDGKAISDEQLARRCGVDQMTWLTLAGELTDFNLLKRTADGILFSPELVAQEEWRSKEAKRKADQRNRGRGLSQECPAESPAQCPADVPDKSGTNSKLLKPSSFSNEKKEGGGTRPPEENPPPTAPSFDSKRQWMELTETEKGMTLDDFMTHLQIRFEKKNVRAIAKKLKKFCDDNGKEFKFERLKGWVYGEGKAITEEEFLAAFGDEPKDWRKIIDECDLCDKRGLIKTEKGMVKCTHEKK